MTTPDRIRIEDEDPLKAMALTPFAVFLDEDAYFLRWGKYLIRPTHMTFGGTTVEHICAAMQLYDREVVSMWERKFAVYPLAKIDVPYCLDLAILRLLEEMSLRYGTRMIVFAKTKARRRVIDINQGKTNAINQDSDTEGVDLFLLCFEENILFAEEATLL